MIYDFTYDACHQSRTEIQRPAFPYSTESQLVTTSDEGPRRRKFGLTAADFGKTQWWCASLRVSRYVLFNQSYKLKYVLFTGQFIFTRATFSRSHKFVVVHCIVHKNGGSKLEQIQRLQCYID